MTEFPEYFRQQHRETFPWHDDCYSWPRLAVAMTPAGTDDLTATELDVHLVSNARERTFWLVGFVGCDRQTQINHVIYFAEKMAQGEVVMFKGLALTDDIVGALVARLIESEPEENPGQMISLVRTNWPTKIQRRVLNKLCDAATPGDLFREQKLAKRLHMPVDEVHHHLQVLADLGLVEEGQP
jgi:hypothetical protein